MTIKEAYKRFLLKVNKNDSNANTRISEAQFVLIFNEQSIVWLSEKIDSKLATDAIDDLEELIEVEELIPESIKNNEVCFTLPINFYKYINSSVTASTSNCSKNLTVYKFKPKNKGIYLQDAFTKPSFEWEETLLSLTNKKAIVYTDGFTVDKLTIEYYKYPEKINIKGYIDIDGNISKDINPTISDKLVNEIINRCASEVNKIVENPQGYQLSETRIIKEK